MKKIILFSLVSIIASCNCKKEMVETKKVAIVTSIQSECPPNGKCSIEVIKNKELNIKTDEFGSVYFTLIDNPNTSVIQYQYNRNAVEGVQDASYKEEIIFEVSNTSNSLLFQDKELQKTKMLFGRICFCRGQTGYYKVVNGSLNLKKDLDNLYKVDLDFKILQVPQLLTKVLASVK